MNYLGIDAAGLREMGGFHTATEICQQPEVWQEVFNIIRTRNAEIRSFLNEAFAHADRIILTGAGTSAFIGLSLQGPFQRNTGILTNAVPNTDIVSHPRDYFMPQTTVLLISFGRSGNSPESTAALALADSMHSRCYHLIITCNSEGDLARYSTGSQKMVIALPAKTNDQSLAMTSSYSAMLLAGLLMLKTGDPDDAGKQVQTIARYGRRWITDYAADLREIAKNPFSRAVFLGSGSLYGTATESHLKLQELTNGTVICKSDSYLGFRHGPKSVVDAQTLVMYILSNDEYASRYERDLIGSMRKGNKPLIEIGIMESGMHDADFQPVFRLSENGVRTDDEWLAVCNILPAQILGFYKSLELGLRPDTPSVNNSITRVVEGVRIYSLT